MTTTVYLVRHAAHDNVGSYLAGRLCDPELGADGLDQAKRLAERLRREKIDLVQSSPLRRTEQTARIIAEPRGLACEIASDLNEIDFGEEWSGRGFEELDKDPRWRRWNAARTLAETPAGETMLHVQKRVVEVVRAAVRRVPDGHILLVSHADVIRAAVMFYLGLSFDFWHRIEISPASVSVLALDDWTAKIVRLNEVTE